MTFEEPQRTPPAAEWLAESMRATNFPSPAAEVDPGAWWHRLLDREPDTRVVRPGVGEWKEEGEFAGGKLTLNINAAGVIQWTLSPTPLKEVPTEFPTVGRFVDACEAFCPLVRRWFEFAPRLDRIAFGTTALLPVANRVEGYRLLSQYLHDVVRIDAERSSDLLYQINRRRHSRSGVADLEINRLSKWSVAEMRILAQAFSAPGVEARLLHPMSACRAELDINTAPEYRRGFASPVSAEIFEELVALAREILETGDRP